MPSPRGSGLPSVRRRTQGPSQASSPSPSPLRIVSTRRRRLWSPPPQPKSPRTLFSSARSNARSVIPGRASAAPLLSSVVVKTPLQPDSPRSWRAHRQGHFPPCPPLTDSSEDDVDALKSVQRTQSPMRMSSPRRHRPPNPPSSIVVDRRRPPPARRGSRGSSSVASTMLASACARSSKAADPERNLPDQPEVSDAGAQMTRSGRLSRPLDCLRLGGDAPLSVDIKP